MSTRLLLGLSSVLLVLLCTTKAFAPSAFDIHTPRINANVVNRLDIHLPNLVRSTRHTERRLTTRTTWSSSALCMSFLPPSGGGNKQDGLGEILGSVLTLLAVGVFFASPLGAIVFAILNSFLALLVLVPIAAVVGFNVWKYTITVSGNCPNCGSPVRVMKDQSPSFCFSCGSILQAKDDQIYIANLNSSLDYAGDDNMVVQDESLASWLGDISGVQRRRQVGKSTTQTTIIDVEVESDNHK